MRKLDSIPFLIFCCFPLCYGAPKVDFPRSEKRTSDLRTSFGKNEHLETTVPKFGAIGSVHVSSNGPVVSVTREPDPEVLAVNPDEGPLYGNVAVNVLGKYFGEEDYGQIALIDGVPCLTTTYISSTQLRCLLPPGTGEKKNVSVKILGVESSSKCLFSYRDEGPFIEQIIPASGSMFGNTEVSIIGSNLGAPELPPAPFIGANPCISSTWKSSNEITCVLPPADHDVTKTDVTVVIAGVKAGGEVSFTYERPEIVRLVPERGPSYGNFTMTTFGRAMGSPITKPTVVLGGNPCLHVDVVSASELRCIMPAG
eukprot:g3946.t1